MSDELINLKNFNQIKQLVSDNKLNISENDFEILFGGGNFF